MIKKIYYDKLFPPLPKLSYSGLKIDEESVKFITTPKITEQIIEILEQNTEKGLKDLCILDVTGGVGGDTIAFGHKFKYVISIEQDKLRYEYLKNNVNLYKLNNVQIYNADSRSIMYDIPNINIYYIDAPWGGSDYKKKKNLRLYLGDTSIEEIILNLFNINKTNSPAELIAIKVPLNFDLKNLYNRIKGDNIKILLYNLHKMYIIVVKKLY